MESITGQDVDGYIIGPLIGGGGMGQVYQAYDSNRQLVAIKILRGEFAEDANFQARFLREVSIMEQLEHPHIVRIITHGMWREHPYFVMQMIKGNSLQDMLSTRTFSPLATWNIIKPVAEALDYGHSKGVMHRDVKPGNVFIERIENKFNIYLGDFGLSKQPGHDETLTKAGVAIGTPEYMSPEAVVGEPIDEQSDLYSLAVMTYELLIGRVPFQKRQPHQTAMAHVYENIPLLMDTNPDFPPALEAVVLRGLAKQKLERYLTIREFASAFYDALSSLPTDVKRKEFWV